MQIPIKESEDQEKDEGKLQSYQIQRLANLSVTQIFQPICFTKEFNDMISVRLISCRLLLTLLLSSTFGGDLLAEKSLSDLRSEYQRPKSIPFPKDNPPSRASENLGRTLFFDPRLSGSNWISCASCHNPGLSWGDGLPKAIGHGMKTLERRTPTILNLAWGELMFWDGRAGSLEEQALAPIAAEGEMNLSIDLMISKLKAIPGYDALFAKAYPGEGITQDAIAKALANFQRTVVSGTAPFDRWVKGDEAAISPEAKRGFAVFNGKALCSQCHSGWRFTDDSFHDIGLPDQDLGRGKILADIEILQHAFKTPTLRNIDHRAPYMHDGSESTLEEVVEFYNKGGKAKRSSLSEHIRPLGLSQREKSELVSFLKTLTSQDKAVRVPKLPR